MALCLFNYTFPPYFDSSLLAFVFASKRPFSPLLTASKPKYVPRKLSAAEMTVPVAWTWILLVSWASVTAAQLNVCKWRLEDLFQNYNFYKFSPVIVTEEEQASPAMEHGLQSALSYIKEQKLADINQNRISLIENQEMASIKALETGRADLIMGLQ